jgi:parallel beta-helix repeat protein
MNKQYRPHPPDGYYFPYRPNGGIVMYDGARFEYNEVKNYGGYMVEISHGDNAIISNNIIHDGWQYGITTAGSSSHYSENARISGNTIYRMGQVGIKMQHTSNSVITNNKITLPSRYDLFTSSWPHNTGSGTPDGSPSPTGIRLYSYDGPNDHVTITGNTIIGNGGNNEVAIESDTSANYYITITNNQIMNAYTGINIKFNNGIITGNTLSDCVYDIMNRGNGNIINNNLLI